MGKLAGVQPGNVFQGVVAGIDGFWVVLTPACDFEQANRIENVLVAQCMLLNTQPEYLAWQADKVAGLAELSGLMHDKRKKQPARYKFLPGTIFSTDLVVDFQHLQCISTTTLTSLSKVAALDSPFAESLLAQFAQYYGRIGTRDLDKTVLKTRLDPPQ